MLSFKKSTNVQEFVTNVTTLVGKIAGISLTVNIN
jgi:hypothetical protein